MTENFFRGRKVLVAGASGFVGTHLSRELIAMGAEVRGTHFSERINYPVNGVEYVHCDLTDAKACDRATADMDFVFMAAANSSGAQVMERTPLVHLTPNLVMNALMLEAAYKNKVKKFCFISSNTVYPVTDHAVREDDAKYEFFDKYHIVGWMKRFSEVMCDMYGSKIAEPLETVVVRPGNLYGPYDKFSWAKSKVIAALIRRAVERHDPFEVWGDGKDIKDFLYIDDFISGLLMTFAAESNGEPVNIASGLPVDLREVIRTVLAQADFGDAEVKFDASKPTMIPRRQINIEKVQALTGWQPQTPLDVGIKKTIDWYREQFADKTPENFT